VVAHGRAGITAAGGKRVVVGNMGNGPDMDGLGPAVLAVRLSRTSMIMRFWGRTAISAFWEIRAIPDIYAGIFAPLRLYDDFGRLLGARAPSGRRHGRVAARLAQNVRLMTGRDFLSAGSSHRSKSGSPIQPDRKPTIPLALDETRARPIDRGRPEQFGAGMARPQIILTAAGPALRRCSQRIEAMIAAGPPRLQARRWKK